MKLVKIRILSGTTVKPGGTGKTINVKAGQVVDVRDFIASLLIGQGQAEKFTETGPAPKNGLKDSAGNAVQTR